MGPCLKLGGILVVTLPVGHNPVLDQAVPGEENRFTQKHYLKRVRRVNHWEETDPDIRSRHERNGPLSIRKRFIHGHLPQKQEMISRGSKRTSSFLRPEILKSKGQIFFFAVLYFLCGADLFFATRVNGFNFRWGQLLLLLAAIRAGFAFHKNSREQHFGDLRSKILMGWLPFFVVYGLAALFSATPFLTGIKWGWGLFNIGLAALVCLQPRRNETIEKGFAWGILATAILLWLQALALYALPFLTLVHDQGEGSPSVVSFCSIFLGYAQSSFNFNGLAIFRPHAFYYEPSYVGAALSFALFLLIFLDLKRKTRGMGFFPAIALSSILLCSSRTGILSVVLFLSLVFYFSRRNPNLSRIGQIIDSRPLLASLIFDRGFLCFSLWAVNTWNSFLAPWGLIHIYVFIKKTRASRDA